MNFISGSLDFIDSSESSFTKFFDRFVQIMETILVEIFREIFEPNFKQRLAFEVKINSLIFLSDQPEAYFFR